MRELLDAIEELRDTYKGDRRWRIEHAQIVDPADLPRFGRARRSIASMQPTHETSDWRMAEARMGIDRLQRRLCLAHDARTTMCRSPSAPTFRSKAPIPSPASPRRSAARTQDGSPPGGWLPEQRLTLEQAFAAFTRGGAYAGFAEDRLGTLEPGRMADFIFIDRDIFAGATPRADPRRRR